MCTTDAVSSKEAEGAAPPPVPRVARLRVDVVSYRFAQAMLTEPSSAVLVAARQHAARTHLVHV